MCCRRQPASNMNNHRRPPQARAAANKAKSMHPVQVTEQESGAGGLTGAAGTRATRPARRRHTRGPSPAAPKGNGYVSSLKNMMARLMFINSTSITSCCLENQSLTSELNR